MHKILIVAATSDEVMPLLTQYNAQKSLFSSKVFSFTHHPGCSVDVLITGVGMIATAFEMGFWVSRRNYQLIINAGVAGSFDYNTPVGSVLQVVADEVAEWGAEGTDTFIPISNLPFFDANAFPYQKARLVQKQAVTFHSDIVLPQAKGITVHKTSGNSQTIKRLRKLYKPDVETMESAAFFYVALSLENTKFAAIRAVSNYVEPRNTSAWNLPLAINNLNEVLSKIVTNKLSVH